MPKKNMSTSFHISNLRQQSKDIAQRFNEGKPVELIEVFSLLEQLIVALDESHLPAEHQHTIEIKSGNAIMR